MRRQRRPSPQTAAVLLALAEQVSDWTHGYDLCGRLGLKAGTMYPILMRLADRGQVETAWEENPRAAGRLGTCTGSPPPAPSSSRQLRAAAARCHRRGRAGT